jgi:5-methylcytosine-specific restriction protein A
LRLVPDAFTSPVTEAEMRRERARARELRATAWWKRRLARGRCGYRVPIVRGGRSTRGNLVAACKACNNAKRHLLPAEWEAYLARLAADADKNP